MRLLYLLAAFGVASALPILGRQVSTNRISYELYEATRIYWKLTLLQDPNDPCIVCP